MDSSFMLACIFDIDYPVFQSFSQPFHAHSSCYSSNLLKYSSTSRIAICMPTYFWYSAE